MSLQHSIRFTFNLLPKLLPATSQVHSNGLHQNLCRLFSTQLENKKESSSGLGLTDSCVEHLKIFSKDGEFLRVSVEGGGCSGFSYKFEIDSEKETDDMTFSREGVKIVTDTESFNLIKGSKIDYETEIIKSAFRVIDNPQSSTNCSCGVSFSIK